jgi:hypothetical protein
MKFNFNPVPAYSPSWSPSVRTAMLAGLSGLAIASLTPSVFSSNAPNLALWESPTQEIRFFPRLPNPQVGNSPNHLQTDPPPPRQPGKGGTT